MLASLPDFAAIPPAYVRPANPDVAFDGGYPIAASASDIRHELLAEMEEEAIDCCHDDWDGYGAKAITGEAFEMARRFVMSLPPQFPRPRVVTDPDGWFAFEWYRGKGRSLVVSVDPAYRVHYSALLGMAEQDGAEPFFNVLPKPVELLLQRLYRF